MFVCLCIHVYLSLSVHLSLYVCLSVSRDFIGKEIVSRFSTDFTGGSRGFLLVLKNCPFSELKTFFVAL